MKCCWWSYRVCINQSRHCLPWPYQCYVLPVLRMTSRFHIMGYTKQTRLFQIFCRGQQFVLLLWSGQDAKKKLTRGKHHLVSRQIVLFSTYWYDTSKLKTKLFGGDFNQMVLPSGEFFLSILTTSQQQYKLLPSTECVWNSRVCFVYPIMWKRDVILKTGST